MARKKLKLFVWENVLTDYTEGMTVAFAYDLDHAYTLIEEADGRSAVNTARSVTPKIVEEAEAFVVWGGG